MVTTLPYNGSSGFKIRRPLITANGFSADLDSTIKDQLNELDTLLGSRLFSSIQDPAIKTNGATDIPKARTAAAANGGSSSSGGAQTATAAATASATSTQFYGLSLLAELQKPVLAKKTTSDHWDNTGILNDLDLNLDKQNASFMTIGDCIDKTNDLAALKYDFQTQTGLNWNFFDYNTKSILGYSNCTDYLIAYAYFVKGIAEVNGLINFVKTHREGATNLVNYAIISASRSLIQSESLNVPEYDLGGTLITYNNDLHPIIQNLITASLPISSASFKDAAQKVINDYIFNNKQLSLIQKAGIGKIPIEIMPQLVKYIKSSPIEITDANVKFFLPLFISQIMGAPTVADTTTDTDTDQSDKDFDVQFLEDDTAIDQVNVSNVKCAAQLFYCMVLGEELDVFNVVNYFTHKFLIRGGIEIQDQKLRADLQTYVFSNKFTDASNGRIVDRTRPMERQMFYRQVFNYGTARITSDVIVNDEFGKLWKVLMYESAKYLERAQESPNPDQYVSRQNVMQAVEDLQYNLSTHCCGMANVITPLIYNELNFVIKNILMHPEVTRQVVPVGGTWWRVVETLYAMMKNSRPKSTVLYNKAKLGQTILKSIAEYNPSTFESDDNYSDFISNVDAFITTQSIIQESLPRDIRQEETRPLNGMNGSANGQNGYTSPAPQPVASAPAPPPAAGPKAGGDEWDF